MPVVEGRFKNIDINKIKSLSMVSLFFQWKTAVLRQEGGAIMHDINVLHSRTGQGDICSGRGANWTVSAPAPDYSPVSDSGRFLWLVPVEPQLPVLGVSDAVAGPI